MSGPLFAQNFIFEFVPTQDRAWQRYLVVDRVSAVFTGLNLSIEPRLPQEKEMANASPEDLAVLKGHLFLARQNQQNYRRFLGLMTTAPRGITWRQLAVLSGFDNDQIEEAISASSGEKLLKEGQTLTSEARLSSGSREIELSWDLLKMAGAINLALPAEDRLKDFATIEALNKKPVMEVIIISGKKYAAWADIDEEVAEGLKRLPYELTVKRLEAASKEGAVLLEEINFALLPVVLFEPKDEQAETELSKFIRQGAMIKTGKTRRLFLAREFSSSGVLWQRREAKAKELKLFVMSECPFGIAAQKAILTAKKQGNLAQDLQLSMHYIVDKVKKEDSDVQFRSLHGTGELEENIRQIVAQKYWPKSFDCYLEKRIADIKSSFWQQALESCGIDYKEFQSLYQKEGEKLLGEDLKLTADYQIVSSPTFLWKNRYLVVGLNGLKKIDEFKDLDLASLQGQSGAPAGACQ